MRNWLGGAQKTAEPTVTFEDFVKDDLWSKFVLEVFYLRDYYVEEALVNEAKGPGFPDFFDIFVYETEF